MQKRKVVTMLAAGTLIGAMAVGGTFAYLTDNEQATNEFTVGEVKIDLTEPNFPGNGEISKMVPNEVIKKDPTVTNTGTNDALVFVEFDVPMEDVILAKADGTRLEHGYHELFDFAKTGGDYDSANDGWIQLSATKDNEANPTKMTYVYGYNAKLAPDQTTKPVFDTVRFANLVEGQAEHDTLKIDVRAYAIQSEYIADVDTSGELTKDILTKAHTVFTNQNKGQDLKEAATSNKLDLKGEELPGE